MVGMFHFSQAIFKKLILVLTVSVLVIRGFGSAGATETRTTDSPVSERKRIEMEASRIKEKVDEKNREFKEFTQKELETVTKLDQIEHSLNQIRQQVAKSEKELSFLAARIETAEASLKKLAEEIDRNEQIRFRKGGRTLQTEQPGPDSYSGGSRFHERFLSAEKRAGACAGTR
jgi:chromosome segregation ATPase